MAYVSLPETGRPARERGNWQALRMRVPLAAARPKGAVHTLQQGFGPAGTVAAEHRLEGW